MRRIYGLHDGSGLVRYVGQTRGTLHYRRRKHVERALLGDRTRRGAWIRDVVEAGAEIVIVELESGDWTAIECNERECAWIARLRSEGADLTNMTSGGAGTRGLPDSARTKLAEAARRLHTGRKRPPSTGQAISASLKRHYTEHPETREKISQGNSGKVRSAETRKKISDARRGKPLSQEHRDAIAAAGRGRTHSEETKRKIGNARRGAHHTPEDRQKIAEGIEANRQRCIACGYESTATWITRHQAKTGHTGREPLSAQP